MKEFLVDLKYGKKILPLRISPDNLLGIIKPSDIPVPPDTGGLIESALDTPMHGPGFDSLFRRGDTISIVVSDITRYTGSHLYLPVMINRLNTIGVMDEDIRIVFSLGIHRQQSPQEQRMIVGDEAYERVKVYDHNAFDPEILTSLGRTDEGTEVFVNSLVAEADKVILTGTITFHYLAGFGGGRKSILPGVSSFDNCLNSHMLVLTPPEVGGKHPKARTGILDGNPFHEAMLQACKLLHPAFLLNTILSTKKEIIQVIAGDYIAAHQDGCNSLLKNFSQTLNEKADMVIVSCGGFPKDINFIQAHKSIDHAIDALKDGGVMIVLAECSDGLGNATFFDWFQYENLMDFEKALRQRFEINGQTAYSTLMKAKKVTVVLISELADEHVRKMSMIPVKSLEQGLLIAHEILGKNPSTYVIPDGGSVLPRIKI